MSAGSKHTIIDQATCTGMGVNGGVLDRKACGNTNNPGGQNPFGARVRSAMTDAAIGGADFGGTPAAGTTAGTFAALFVCGITAVEKMARSRGKPRDRRASKVFRTAIEPAEGRVLCSITVPVPGTANPYLANPANAAGPQYAADGTTPPSIDVAGDASLTFDVTGGTTNNLGVRAIEPPDGGALVSAYYGARGGISAWDLPIDVTAGVFLGASIGTAPAAYDGSLSAELIAPPLGQVFPIGDGLTGVGTGDRQEFKVPAGATRLFLVDIDGFQWANNGGTLEVTVDPTAVTPTSLAWNTAKGGVDLAYASADPVPVTVPVSFYWSANPGFNAGQDTLAATSMIKAGQKPSTIHIDPSDLTAPPDGTGYLLAVLDPNHTVLPQGSGNTLSLAYDPTVTVTGKYDGSSDPGVIGRFLAKPGLVSERFIDKLSPSLAALRPEVITFINDGESLEASPDVVGLGWDGVTYETGGFDPGKLSGPATLSTVAQTDNRMAVLQQVKTTLEVEPIPDWYGSLKGPTITFTAGLASADGALQGSYDIKGLLADLALPINATIPKGVALVGGKSVGGAANFGIDVKVPLNTASKPVVSGYSTIDLTLLGATVYSRTFAPTTTVASGGGATLTVEPQVDLDPETLKPDGSFSVLFKAGAGGELSNRPLYTGSRILTVAGVPFKLGYGLDENVNYTLDADADVSFSPGSGFSLDPEQTFVSAGITGSIVGNVTVGYYLDNTTTRAVDNILAGYLPQYFTKNTTLPGLSLGFVVSGGFGFDSVLRYTGTATSSSSSTVSFGGSLTPKLQSNIKFTIGTFVVSLPVTTVFDSIPSLVFSGNGQYTFNSMGH